MKIRFSFAALIIVSALAFCSCSHPAVTGMKEPTMTVMLYPEGQHVDRGIVEDGVEITLGPGVANDVDTTEFFWDADGSLNFVSDGARVEIYLPEERNGQMVVMCPGGGYGELSKRNEGDYVAQTLTARGYCVAVVCYRLPTGHDIIPPPDVQNAFRYCRYHAAEWGVTQIGVMGGSAGGHLASIVSTMYVDSITRPDFTVLLYPVISSEEAYRHGGTFRNLTGFDPELMEYYSSDRRVTSDTPPAALFHSADDKGVKVENSIRYFNALRAAGVRAELYIFPTGGHGWGFTTMETAGRDRLGKYRPAFFDALYAFLDDMAASSSETE